MSLKKAWTFAHLNGITTQNASGGALAYTAYTMTFNPIATGPVAGVTSAGWLATTSNTTGGLTTAGRLEVIANTVVDWTTRSSWLGFGYMGTNTAGSDPQTIFSWLTSGTRYPVLSESEIPAGFNKSQQYWIEIQIDRTNLAINVYVDGVFLKTLSYTAAQFVATSTFLYGHGAQIGTVANDSVRFFREFYYVDDTQDSTICTRMGPQMVVPINAATVVGSGWSNGLGSSLVTPLNMAQTGTPPTPSQWDTSPLSQNALTATLALNGTLQTQQTIQAVTFVTTAQKGNGSSSYLQNKVTDGTNTKNLTSINFASTAWKYNADVGLMEKAPDGSAWTTAKIAAASLVMTPSTTA